MDKQYSKQKSHHKFTPKEPKLVYCENIYSIEDFQLARMTERIRSKTLESAEIKRSIFNLSAQNLGL